MLTSKLLILIGVSLQAWDAMAVIYRQTPLRKPAYCAHEVGCFSPITKKVLPFRVDVYPTGVCKRLTCQSNGYTLVHSCEKKVVPRGCHLSRDRKLHYPHCCAKVVCPTPRHYVVNDRYYNEERHPYVDQSQYYDDADYVEVRPRRYAVVDHHHKAVVYNDGRGDDYKLNEDKKIISDNKNETSRRAPWNKNGDVSSHHVTPEYSAHDHEGGRVVYYKPDNRGDDYKSKEDKKILYDKKKESSRRAPWNKNKNIDGYSEEEIHPYADESQYDDDADYVEVRPRRYAVVDHHHKAVVYNDGRGDDYKLNEDKKVIYDNKDETSRRAPWNKNGDVSSHRVTPEYSTHDHEGGRVDYYKPDNRGDDYKSKADKKILYDKKKESSRRAPWNKNKNINYGADYDTPEYYADDNEGGTVAYYKPNYRGDDYKLEEDKKEYYNDKDESSRRSPWNDSEAEGEYVDDPEYDDDTVGFDDGRGDNYKSHEKQGIQSYDHKKVTSRRAPWNDNSTV